MKLLTLLGQKFASPPDIATWNGTIVAMRIPYINEGFNYIRFVE